MKKQTAAATANVAQQKSFNIPTLIAQIPQSCSLQFVGGENGQWFGYQRKEPDTNYSILLLISQHSKYIG